MPLDESHPHVVLDEQRLVLVEDPVEYAVDREVEAAWRKRMARAGTVSVPLGGVAGLSLGLALGLDAGGPVAVVGGLLVGTLLGFALGAMLCWPRPAGPRPRTTARFLELHPLLVTHAPADTPYDRLLVWQKVCDEYEAAHDYLAKGRHDAALSEAERQVSPGDRTTWFYGPDDLPGLEGRYAVARDDLHALATQLGAMLPADDF